MQKVDAPVATVDLHDHKLAAEATDNQETASHGLVHLHDACDVVLTVLETDVALVLSPVEVQRGLIDAG